MDQSNVLKAAQFIEDNLDQTLDLELIARKSGVSPYHFHRLFQGHTGDNPMEYVRKRRLTVAAERLLSEKTRILDIAIGAGFESQESFSRAFKKNFNATPGQFRKNGHKKHMRSRYPIDEEILKHLRELEIWIPVEPK